MKLLSCILMFAACSLLSACGGSEDEMSSGAITPDVKSQMEKEQEEVFQSESAHREAMQQHAKGK